MKTMQTKILKGKHGVRIIYYITLGIAGFIIIFNAYGPLSYLTGLMNSVILYCASALINLASYACILLLACYAIASLYQLFRNKKHNKLNRILVIAFVVIIFFIAFTPKPDRSPWWVYQTEGLRDRMKKKADIKAIRDWLLTLGPTEHPDSYVVLSHYMITGDEKLPESVKDLKPSSFHVKKYDEDNFAYFVWGAGHLGVWGFIVGPPDRESPLSNYGQYVLSVGKGAWVWTQNE